MRYCFDIDGVLCTNTQGKYEHAHPYVENIRVVNALYDAGHDILLYTARGATTGIDWRQLTVQQLSEWGVKHHTLMMGKPHYDVIIDDKSVDFIEFFEKQRGLVSNG